MRVHLTAPYSLYERFYNLSIDKTVVESGDIIALGIPGYRASDTQYTEEALVEIYRITS